MVENLNNLQIFVNRIENVFGKIEIEQKGAKM